MIGRARALRPAKQAVRFGDRQVVDAGMTHGHVALGIELPVLVTVGAVPLPSGVVPFVGETHRDAVPVRRPQVLDQPVVELLRPLAREKGDDLGASGEELVAVSPAAVGRVGQRDRFRIAPVPRVFGRAHLDRRRLGGERGERRTGHGFVGAGAPGRGGGTNGGGGVRLCAAKKRKMSAMLGPMIVPWSRPGFSMYSCSMPSWSIAATQVRVPAGGTTLSSAPWVIISGSLAS